MSKNLGAPAVHLELLISSVVRHEEDVYDASGPWWFLNMTENKPEIRFSEECQLLGRASVSSLSIEC